MGKAGKRKEIVEDRSIERVLCEKFVCEKAYAIHLKKICVSSAEMVEGRLCERGTYERVVCERAVGVSVCERVVCERAVRVRRLCVRERAVRVREL